MAIESLEHATTQDNDNLLIEIAKVYTSLEKLQELGSHLWPEDEDALLLCLDRLFNAAMTLEIKSPEGCLAMAVIAKPQLDEQSESPCFYEKAQSKITTFALKQISTEEQGTTLTI